MATLLTTERTPAADEQSNQRHALITHYINELRWPLVVEGGEIFLPADFGIVGLTLPAGLAGEVNTEVVRREIAVPILAVPGRSCRWVFLVEPPTDLGRGLPVGVGLMTGPSRIPLPPTDIDGEPVRWIAEPRRNFFRVPSFASVLSAVRHITSPRSL